MWFKNLRIYTLTKPFALNAEQLDEKLAVHAFIPCGNLDVMRYGWVPPLGKHGTSLVHVTDGCIMICAKKQEKILPSAVVNEHLDERVAAISKAEDRRVSRKERLDLKDEIIFSLLPKAFTRSRLDFAYIDTKAQMIIVNSSSAKRAEDLLAALRNAIESLPCLPLETMNLPAQVMTDWLSQGHANNPFYMGEDCDLRAPKDGRIVRCKKQDLSADEIRNHLNVGMVVEKMNLGWRDAIQFTLNEQLGITRVKFVDELIEKASKDNPETAAEEFDCEFAIMALEVRSLINDVVDALGGREITAADMES